MKRNVKEILAFLLFFYAFGVVEWLKWAKKLN